MSHAKSAEKVVQDIRRKTQTPTSRREENGYPDHRSRGCGNEREHRWRYCRRREGLNANLYVPLEARQFLEAGKKRLVGDITREADVDGSHGPCGRRMARLKHVVAELVLENRLLKKSVTASDSEGAT